MKNIILTILVAAIISFFVAGFSSGSLSLGGDGDSNFTNVVASGSLTVGSSAATTSSNLGRSCLTTTDEAGSTLYFYVASTGDWATTTTSCN